jgi:cell division protein FtsN
VTAASPTPAPAAKPIAAKAAPAPAKSVEKAAERIANDMAPAADPKKTREPSSVLPTVATTAIGKYTVQVASYATEGEAKDQAAKLTGKGYSAFYIPATINNKTWYRVSVGLFSDQKSATNYRTELLATQAVGSAIVQKIVK